MRHSISGVFTLLGLVPALLLGCSGEDAPGPTAASPTFHRDVEPLLQEHCMSCHSPGNIAPFSLTTYDAARSVELIARAGKAQSYLDGISISWADVPEGRGPTGRVIRTGEIQIVSDFGAEPAFAPWRARAHA